MPATIHFGGAAYLVPYFMGVGRCLQDHAGGAVAAAGRWRFSGGSAGAAVAAFLATGLDLVHVQEVTLAWSRGRTRWLSPLNTFQAVDFGARLVTGLPCHEGHLRILLGHARARRRFPFVEVRTRVRSRFRTVEEVRDAVRESAFLPSLSRPAMRRGRRWLLDGAMLALVGRGQGPSSRALRVGVVPWGNHIAPQGWLPGPFSAAVMRPVPEMERLSAMGYADAARFLAARKRW
jgi:hypothetical protein